MFYEKIEMRFVKMTIWIVIIGTIGVVRRLAIITNRRLTQKIISRKNINFNIEVEP